MSEPLLTVYSQPNCLPCTRVIKQLRDAGLKPDVVDITENDLGYSFVKHTLGAKSTPVIVSDVMNPIVGYQPDKVRELIVTLNADKIHDHVGEEE